MSMIAPNYWLDYKTGNDYFLTVQYYEHGRPAIHNLLDLRSIPLKAPNLKEPTTLDSVIKLSHTETATEVDHYQIQRAADVYVTPKGEDLGRIVERNPDNIVAGMKVPGNVRVTYAEWSKA